MGLNDMTKPRNNRKIIGIWVAGGLVAGLVALALLNLPVGQTCHVDNGVSTTNEFGNTVLTFTGTGDCTDVAVDLVAVTGAASKVIQTDELTGDQMATFTYNVPVAGTAYEFVITGDRLAE